MKLRYAILALAVLVANSSAAAFRDVEKRQFPGFGGGKTLNDYKRQQVAGRDIHVYAPPNLPANSPLLLSLHGMDQDPNYQQSNTHWETLAEKENFVVVYPRGGTGMGTWDIQGDKDTKWVLQIIDQMVKDYKIDRSRVYLSGFSMGGMFTYHAMSKIGDKIAAYAPCSGPNVFGASKAMRPVPIFHVHGTNDSVLNYNQVEGFLKNYRDQFHCPAQADVKTNYPNSENPNATLYSWGPCDKGVYIKHLKLQGRDHSPSKADIQDIWNFVKEYNLEGKISDKPADKPDDKCWSKSLGYPCCTKKSVVVYTDSNGQWGLENNDWCGIPNTNNKNCWAKALGYKCCSTNVCRNAEFNDEDGQWDLENGEWCGITTSNVLC